MDEASDTELVTRLKERVEIIRAQLVSRGRATDAEIDAHLPGGPENGETGELGWALAYGDLRGLLAERGSLPSDRAERKENADAVLLAALADAPMELVLTGAEGEDFTVGVYPKSYEALRWFDSVSRKLQWLVDRRRDIETQNGAEIGDLIQRIGDEEAWIYGLVSLAALTGGPGLPWERGDEPRDLPEWVRALSPSDVLRIRRAFIEVNSTRLSVLNEILSPASKRETTNLSWAPFFATRAEESGEDSKVLLRDRSLASQLAASALSADVKLTAMQKEEKSS